MAAMARRQSTREDRGQLFSCAVTGGLINHEVFWNQACFDLHDTVHVLKRLDHDPVMRRAVPAGRQERDPLPRSSFGIEGERASVRD